MTRLFIENFELDVNNNFTHQLNYAIDDVTSVDSKRTSFSKTIVLPGTTNNNKLLGNIFEFGNSNFNLTSNTTPNVGYNFNASKSAKARIEMSGLTCMKGVIRLLEIIIDGDNIEYEVAVFGELGGFISNIGGKLICLNSDGANDLDFSYYNHVYNVANLTATWNRSFSTQFFKGIFNATTKTLRIGDPYVYWNNFQAGDVVTIAGTTSNNGSKTITSVVSAGVGDNIFAGWKETVITFSDTIVTETDFIFTITSSRLVGKGYIYPLINYGNVTFNVTALGANGTKYKDYQYTAFRPALYVRDIFDRIICGAGYTWESKFANTDFFNRLIIPNNEKGLLNRSAVQYISATKSTTSSYAATYPTQLTTLIPFNAGATLANFSVNGANTIYTYTGANPITIKISLTLSGTASRINNGSVNCYVVAKDNATGVETLINAIEVVNNVFPSSNTPLTTFNIVNSQTLTLTNNSTISLKGTITNPSNYGATPRGTLDVTSSTLVVVNDPPTAVSYELGQTLNINNLLPKNILQKDFFTSILKMFNLMVTEDKVKEKHLIIEPWVNFYQKNLSSYLDWSDKIDKGSPIKVKPMSEVTSRYYQFKYKSDTDFYNDKYKKQYNEGYGDRTFDNALDFAKESQSTEVIFAATPIIGFVGYDKIVPTILKMNNTVEESIESVLRIMQVKRITGVTGWNILNQNTVNTGPVTSYCYAGHFNDPTFPTADINFGSTKELYYSLTQGSLQNNMFNAYYSSYMAEITDKDSRVVSCKAYLKPKDIYNLDFSRLIYIEGVLYRLLKVSNYSEDEVTEIELLRVINLEY